MSWWSFGGRESHPGVKSRCRMNHPVCREMTGPSYLGSPSNFVLGCDPLHEWGYTPWGPSSFWNHSKKNSLVQMTSDGWIYSPYLISEWRGTPLPFFCSKNNKVFFFFCIALPQVIEQSLFLFFSLVAIPPPIRMGRSAPGKSPLLGRTFDRKKRRKTLHMIYLSFDNP